MDKETKLTAVCKGCGKPFDKDKEGADDEQLYCSRCMVERAEEHIQETEKVTKLERVKPSKLKIAFQLVILLICIVIIAIQIPKLISAFEEDKPIRYGTYLTDEQTDQCIKNLWHISKLLQEGKLPGRDIVCPVSKKPYVVVEIKGDTVVRCPNPARHGFREIRVSKKSPCPEVEKWRYPKVVPGDLH